MEEKDTVLFRFIIGSHSYGTNVPGSDKDFMTVYLQEPVQRWANPKNAVKHVKYENGEEIYVDPTDEEFEEVQKAYDELMEDDEEA